MKNTIYKPVVSSHFVRTHRVNGNNYLLIYEVVRIKTKHDSGFSYSCEEGQKELKHEYELDFKNQEQNFDFIKESMSSENVATNKYKYYRIIFANGLDIICQTFEEFHDFINKPETSKS
ncbi:hypothetical protein M0Q97_12645 [Candidatus Dojkabacteria bacterium]|jgi:hypothetical protein|nr:hypothetical protein [Candidatus Dojkabacteria bacterium]